MNNYLIELFKNENTVIIPGFGALTMVNRATYELMFMSFMKHNDGSLVNFISEVDGIEKNLAQSKLDAFIDEINYALNSNQPFILEGLGRFERDGAGDVQFYSNTSENAGATSAVLAVENVVSEPIIEATVAPVVEELQISSETIVDKIEEPVQPVEAENIELKVEPEIIPEIEVEPQMSVKQVEEKIEDVVNQTETEQKRSEEEQWNDDLDVPPLNYKVERPKQPILEKTKKDKKPRGVSSIWLIFFAVLIFGGATYVGLNYSTLSSKIPFLAKEKKVTPFEAVKEQLEKKEVAEKTEDLVVEDPVVETETEQNEEVTPVETVEPVKVPVSSSSNQVTATPKIERVTYGNFKMDKSLPIQVIVGSFGNENNANRMVAKLNKQGFPAAILGTFNGLHTVSAISFSSMSELNENLDEIQKLGVYWIKK